MTIGPERQPVDSDLLRETLTAACMRIGPGHEELVEALIQFWNRLWTDVAPAMDARLREDEMREFLSYAAVVLECTDRDEGVSHIASALPEVAIMDHFGSAMVAKMRAVHRFGADLPVTFDDYSMNRPIDRMLSSAFAHYVADLGAVPPELSSRMIDAAELPHPSTEALATIQWERFSSEIWETWWENPSETFEYRVDLLRRRLGGLVRELAAPEDLDW
jgi:hypothetical protein